MRYTTPMTASQLIEALERLPAGAVLKHHDYDGDSGSNYIRHLVEVTADGQLVFGRTELDHVVHYDDPFSADEDESDFDDSDINLESLLDWEAELLGIPAAVPASAADADLYDNGTLPVGALPRHTRSPR